MMKQAGCQQQVCGIIHESVISCLRRDKDVFGLPKGLLKKATRLEMLCRGVWRHHRPVWLGRQHEAHLRMHWSACLQNLK